MHSVRRHSPMLVANPPTFLLASSDPALLTAIEPVLAAGGGRVQVVLSADSALAAMRAQDAPSIVVLDDKLTGMTVGQLLASALADSAGKRFPVVLVSDAVT